MILHNNGFIDNTATSESRKKKAHNALHDAFKLAEAGDWAAVIDSGLEYPENMDEIIDRFYDDMPDKIRYILPVKWFMATGKASENVCKAVELASKYKPVLWIGKGSVKADCFEVFCCCKARDKEEAKSCLLWALDYGTAYAKAMKNSLKVFKGFINKENIIAFDNSSAEPVIQFRSVYAVQQVFPKLPLSCRKEAVSYA